MNAIVTRAVSGTHWRGDVVPCSRGENPAIQFIKRPLVMAPQVSVAPSPPSTQATGETGLMLGGASLHISARHERKPRLLHTQWHTGGLLQRPYNFVHWLVRRSNEARRTTGVCGTRYAIWH